MIALTEYISINEALDDNLYYKLDRWFDNDPDGKKAFINVVSNCKNVAPLNVELVKALLSTIKLDVNRFIDFIMDNIDNTQQINDYMYIMMKVIETIIANKTNDYNTEQ